MRIVILTFILLVCLNSTACFSQYKHSRDIIPLTTKTDGLSNDAYIWDFGKVKEGEVSKHDFVLRNDTGHFINITGIKSSCGCTASEVKNKSLAPQGETTVTVQFNSKGYSGNVRHYVYVHTDNIDNPVLRLVIKAEVK